MSKNLALTLEELVEASKDTEMNEIARGYFAYINIRVGGYFKNLKAQIISKEKDITTNNLVFFSEFQKDNLSLFEAVDIETLKYFTSYINSKCNYNRKLHRNINLALLKEAKKLSNTVTIKCL
ncbi:MAG: hypothetical protein ACRCTZ_01970 [Sarcina sp.]